MLSYLVPCVVTGADTVGPQLSKYLCVTSMLKVFR